MKLFAKKSWRFCLAAVLLLVAGIFPASGAEPKRGEHALAIAYTETNYGGVAWPIFEEGKYDLFKNFGLPNDTIASIRVAPGWAVTLFEHAKFEGKTLAFTKSAANLGPWKNSVSSLTVTRIGGKNVPGGRRYLDEYLKDIGRYRGAYREADILARIGALPLDLKKKIRAFQDEREGDWYGGTTDDERIAKGGELLKLFKAIGVKTAHWKNHTFAQRLNNFYDWDKSWSVWKMACMAINVENTQEGNGG
jgi:hypothetical protein